MHPVNSTRISYAGWEDNTLYLTFNRGAQYKYLGVPREVLEKLLDSASPGNYFEDEIKGVYKVERI